MATRRFEVHTTGAVEGARRLQAIGGRGADARPAWPLVFEQLSHDVEERFRTRGGETKWQPLAPSTVASKARKNEDPRIMRASNALYTSLTIPRGKKSLRRKAKTQARHGTTLFYARFHQYGAGVPKRPVLDVSERLEKSIAETLELFVAKGQLKRGASARFIGNEP